MLSDTAAARERTTGEDVIIKVIEVKRDSDGVNVAYTGKTISLERAFQCGLIVASDYAKVLESQKTPHDVAEDVSQCEPVQEVEPCEVNSLISKRLSGNKSPISLRNAHALRLLSPQLKTGDLNKCQDMEQLNVDAAVQCDLMSSSSTLVVLGGQQQYLGVVLSPCEEVQVISKSLENNKLSATTEFTSSVFSKKEKIAAFYIPQVSEVVDFNVAVQEGFIDSYTAELLKTVEIPDVVADIDHLNEKFSSWLMYRKLTVDGCCHAADCLKVDNIPSLTEAEQLFISYLMINSYIDAQTGKRVVILDRELSKMVKVFLEDPMSYEDGDKQATSLDLNVSSLLQQADEVYINEETDVEMEDEQYTCEPPYFVSSVNGRVSSRVEAYTRDQAVNHHPVMDVTDDNGINVEEKDLHAAEKTVCLTNTDWTKSGEFIQLIYRNDSHTADGGSGESSGQTPQHNTESICRELDFADSFEAEFLHPEDLLDNEQDFVSEVLEAHVKEDNSDIPSVGPSEINASITESLMDKEAFLKLLNSHPEDRGSAEGDADEWDSMSDFKENVSVGHHSSHSAYFLSEKQTISRSGCAISISESFQAGITEDEFVVSDPETSMYPQEDFPYTSRSNTLAFMDANGTEKQPTVGKAVASGAAQDTEIGREITGREVDYETGDVEEMSYSLDCCLPADDDRGSQIFSLSLWSQVTTECIRHTSRSLTDCHDSQGMSNSQATGATDGENSQTSDERGNSESQTQYTTFSTRANSDSPLFVEKVLITESDSEVETQEFSECESEKSTRETEMSALQPHLHSEPTACGRYSSRGVERDIVSDSSTEDGTRVTSPQPTEDDSEKVFCVEQRVGQQVLESASSSDDIIVPDPFKRFTDGDSVCEESHTAIRTFPEAELVDQDMPGSLCSSVDGELSTSFSPERQHGNRFIISSDSDQICFLKPPVPSNGDVTPGEMSSDQAETAVKVHSGCETPTENSSTAEHASERAPFCQTNLPDVPSDGCITSDTPSGVSRVVKTCSDELSDLRGPQQAEDVESTHSIFLNTSKPGEKYDHKPDTLQALVESRHPDLFVDLLKRNTHNLESKEGGDPQQEGKVVEKTEEFPNIQQQLLCVLKTVTSGQDLSMIQEVMQSLNMNLGSNTPEVQRHLDSIREESLEEENEGSAKEDSPPSSASSHSCKVKQTEEVC